MKYPKGVVVYSKHQVDTINFNADDLIKIDSTSNIIDKDGYTIASVRKSFLS